MLDKLVKASENWIALWGEVLFSPKAYFQKKTERSTAMGLEFYVGNMFFAYLLTILTSLVFFAVFHFQTLQGKFAPRIGEDFAYITKLFAAYVILIFIVLFISSFLCFAIAKLLQTNSQLNGHLSLYLHLTAIEPFAALSSALVFLSDGKGFLFWLAILPFLLSRLWGLYAGYWGIVTVHSESKSPHAVYAFGYVPSQLIFNTFLLALMWMILSWGIVPYWD